MTTKIKNLNAIKTLIATALTNANVESKDLAVTKSGKVTFSIADISAIAAKPGSAKTEPKAHAAPESGLMFAYGERNSLKAKYAEDYKNLDGLQLNFFGRVTEVKGVKVLVIGIKDGKVLVRKDDGKRSKISAKSIVSAMSENCERAKVAASTNTAKPESKPKTDSKSWVVVDTTAKGPKLDKETTSELRAKFKKVAAKRDIDLKFKQVFQKGDTTAQLVGIVEHGTKLRMYVPKTQKFVRVALDNVSA